MDGKAYTDRPCRSEVPGAWERSAYGFRRKVSWHNEWRYTPPVRCDMASLGARLTSYAVCDSTRLPWKVGHAELHGCSGGEVDKLNKEAGRADGATGMGCLFFHVSVAFLLLYAGASVNRWSRKRNDQPRGREATWRLWGFRSPALPGGCYAPRRRYALNVLYSSLSLFFYRTKPTPD